MTFPADIRRLLDTLAREQRSLRKGLDRMREELRAQAVPAHALKRAEAAKAMGVSISKLDALVRVGKVRTADDVHLIPMSEVRRYTAPKQRRQRRPAVGHRARQRRVDTQSDEAWDDVTQRVKASGAAP